MIDMTVTDVRHGGAAADVRRAWWSLLAFLPAFGLAFAVGEGLAAALGYPPGGADQAPWWVMVVATVPALVVFVVPAVLSWHFGRRAMALGDPRGRYPVVVALVVAGGFVLLNLVSGVAVLVSG
ncbi:hypothetical protein ASC64_05080 [Nocardioides sp. Root122]|nr:hypothetical protein ASC64_05080 [Nocardioides sp. Root122]